ncbi:hypothetical protein NA57DRAFT_82147 [Rhizodiscina lignyota]|uniref:Uncharacterized protein n=1 Tax=Rhizodiscina lignyota TaxID=1504668 RepID=A0A9P4M2S6_9PEZI|nr:hypothetical protein NA57DRAFT_82147 [Rhizodiscina lignyota]
MAAFLFPSSTYSARSYGGHTRRNIAAKTNKSAAAPLVSMAMLLATPIEELCAATDTLDAPEADVVVLAVELVATDVALVPVTSGGGLVLRWTDELGSVRELVGCVEKTEPEAMTPSHFAAAHESQVCVLITHVSLGSQVGQVGVVEGHWTQRRRR